jgi:signal transduction histidine kinase/CheY-like chemotaxis protein
MSAEGASTGLNAALSMRAKSVVIRIGIMALVAIMLWTFGDWPIAPLWWATYVVLQWTAARLYREGADKQPRIAYAMTTLSYAVAGFPAWHMWVNLDELGIAASTMFLCGMLVQLVVSSLGAGRLFWSSASPLIGYLIVVPIVARWDVNRTEGLVVAASACLLVLYMTVLWIGQQRALAEIRDSRLRAEAASQAKTDFLAIMSHELRTPMNAVLGATDLLGRTDLNEEQKGHVAILADGGSILMHVLNDVLDLAKIEAGKLSIDPSRTDIHDFVRRSGAFWSPRADDKGLKFTVSVSPEVPQFVIADATRLGQIAFNLISNAVKFTEAGEVRILLQAEAKGEGATDLILSVTDTGIGLSQDAVSRLFTAFQQADGSISRRFGGTGLGLSISQKLAEMMGGAITVTSTPDQGSSFTLRVPAEVAPLTEVGELSLADTLEELLPAIQILVAEDNLSNQRIIDYFLRPLGAAVTIVGDGQQALDALAVTAFDLVLMDMQMPVMDGLEATRRLRASGGPNAGIPILALTANVMDSQKQACFDAGMDGHIAKPIDARLLISGVISAIDAERPATMAGQPAARATG